jgi:hypothetical protein
MALRLLAASNEEKRARDVNLSLERGPPRPLGVDKALVSPRPGVAGSVFFRALRPREHEAG